MQTEISALVTSHVESRSAAVKVLESLMEAVRCCSVESFLNAAPGCSAV